MALGATSVLRGTRAPRVLISGPLFTGRPTSAVVRAARKTEKFALEKTRQRSRVDTGLMRRSWYTDLKTTGAGVQLEIKNDVFYSVYQEYGTSNISPMHAATATLPDAANFFRAELQKELQSELGGAIESVERSTLNVLTKFFKGFR